MIQRDSLFRLLKMEQPKTYQNISTHVLNSLLQRSEVYDGHALEAFWVLSYHDFVLRDAFCPMSVREN